ncbi:MAG TPA: hypothetical protein DCF97_09345 [Plesiomonas shigelloides]|nr:hypothetical protein [Plesiomonas shigelloides]
MLNALFALSCAFLFLAFPILIVPLSHLFIFSSFHLFIFSSFHLFIFSSFHLFINPLHLISRSHPNLFHSFLS